MNRNTLLLADVALIVTTAAIGITLLVRDKKKKLVDRYKPGRHRHENGDVVMFQSRNSSHTLVWGHAKLANFPLPPWKTAQEAAA